MDDSGSVTLIFYSVGNKWWREPALNLIAAVAQFSAFTHVEVAIGSEHGARGEMSNVSRIFNEKGGAELAARTGRNPQYTYLQIGCSKNQENAMLKFARSCVGKPFSGSAMARSLVWPRQTDNSSFFCAELVAAVLKEGGLIDKTSNPGAATPEALHRLFKGRAATTANPFLLRQANVQRSLTTNSLMGHSNMLNIAPQRQQQQHHQHVQYTPLATSQTAHPAFVSPHLANISASHAPLQKNANSSVYSVSPALLAATASRHAPVCGMAGSHGTLRVLHVGQTSARPASSPLGITLNSLDFRKR